MKPFHRNLLLGTASGGLVGALWLRFRPLPAPSPQNLLREPPPSSLPPTPPSPPVPVAPTSPDSQTFRTPPSETLVGSGWVEFNGLEYTRLPLVDRRNSLFARLTYRDAVEAAKLHGGRLPTKAEAKAIWDKGNRVEAKGLVRGGAQAKADISRMQTLGFARRYDEDIWQQLKALGTRWRDDAPTANVGKWWVYGAPPGRAWLYGWWSNDKPIQSGPPEGQPAYRGPHDDSHFDYGTLTYVVREIPGDNSPMPNV